jgi:predicted MFS family arabinose efflux permease
MFCCCAAHCVLPQGIFQATYLSIGGGLGGIIGGLLMEAQGGEELFKYSALMVLAGWAGAVLVEKALGLEDAGSRQQGNKVL